MSREITRADSEWPKVLDELDPEEQVTRLYLEGRSLEGCKDSVAVVGTRNATSAGLDAAHEIALGLAEAGFVIVSGLARGVDAAAHRAALEAGGHTVAVLGCGTDVTYPNAHKRLQASIQVAGTLVSEYPPGTAPKAFHFPQRNRIIAGLSRAVVVIEGGFKSGALITARQAVDANRHVFAVPGSVRNAMAAGPNELIRTSQAALVTDFRQILDELAPSMVWDGPCDPTSMDRQIRLSDDESKILMLLDDAPLLPDSLCRRLSLPAGAVAITLSRLEVRGLAVRRRAGYEITTAGARARAVFLDSVEV